MRLIAWVGLALLSGLLQGCLPGAIQSEAPGGLVGQDRRAEGARSDDAEIEAKAAELVYDQSRVFMHVNVSSFNRKVLVSGEVPNEATRSEVEKSVASIEKAGEIISELTVGNSSSMLSRSNDSLITSNVKLKFVADRRFDSNHVRVVTENGTVFLMGIVKRSEADAAAGTASTAKGVQRVVKLFEYMD